MIPQSRSVTMAESQDRSGENTRGRWATHVNPSTYQDQIARWAIIIGISKYRNTTLNLKYAHRDAEELYDLLRKPSGGDFAEDHICKLINAQATTEKITWALRSFLKKPARSDLVLI